MTLGLITYENFFPDYLFVNIYLRKRSGIPKAIRVVGNANRKRNVTIDGLAIGLMAHPSVGGHLQIRGLNHELIPLAIFTLPGSMFTTILNPLVVEFYAAPAENVTIDLRGISISGGMFEEVAMGGVSLSINSYVSYSNGLEVSMFMNSNYQYSGAQLALFGNRAIEGSGLQLGMFNSCQDCRGNSNWVSQQDGKSGSSHH